MAGDSNEEDEAFDDVSKEICERDMQILTDAVSRLGMNFDAVQIFVTRKEPGSEMGTIHAKMCRIALRPRSVFESLAITI